MTDKKALFTESFGQPMYERHCINVHDRDIFMLRSKNITKSRVDA